MTQMRIGRWLLLAAGAATLAAVIIGLSAVDPPWTARLLKQDEARVKNLQALASSVDFFWRQNKRLPTSLTEAIAVATYKAPSTDPVSGEAYEYRPGNGAAFELCASFAKEETEGQRAAYMMGGTDRNWRHPAGRHCFSLHAK